MSHARGEAGSSSSEDGDQESVYGEGPLRRPDGPRSGARRAVAGAFLTVAACGAAAWAPRRRSTGGFAPGSGPVDSAAGTVLNEWDSQVRPKLGWDAQDDFDPQGFFDDLATNKDLTEKYTLPTPEPSLAMPLPTLAPKQQVLPPAPGLLAHIPAPPPTPAPTGPPVPAPVPAPSSGPSGAEPATALDLVAEAVEERVPTALATKPSGLPAALWPRPGKTLLLIGQDSDSIEGYTDAFGTPAGFSVHVRIEDVGSGLWWLGDWGAGPQCADCLLQKYGQGVAFNLAVDIVDTVDDVAAGAWDDNIRSLASWVKTTGGPVYMRPGHEFDGERSRFEPEAYKLAYRRFVDLFWVTNVTNVLWVWQSAVLPNYKGFDRMDWYPGDNYVDLFGASVFTALYADGHPYKRRVRQEMKDLQDWAMLAAARRKPVVIVQSTARAYRMTYPDAAFAWESWFRPMFEFIEQNDVRLFAYINCNWDTQPMWSDDSWGDTRLQANQNLTARWKFETVKTRWLNVFLPFSPE